MNVGLKEAPDVAGNLLAIFFQGEVSGIQQVDFDGLQVACVGVGAGGGEDLVVLAPDDQGGRLMGPEVGLPLGIEGRVGAVVIK